MQLRCTNCGAPLGPNDTFCGECGAPVIRPTPTPPGGPANPQIAYSPPFSQVAPVKKRGGNTLAIVVSLVVILAVAAVGGWLLFGNKGGSSTNVIPPPVGQSSPTTNIVALTSPTAPAQPSPTKAAPTKPFIRGNIRKLTNNTDPNANIYNVAWSYSAKSLAYSLADDSGQHIFTIPRSGGPPKQLTFGADVQDYKPIWFGDTTVAFTRKLNDTPYLYYVAASGDVTPTRLIATSGYSEFQLVDSNSTGLFTGREAASTSNEVNLYNFRFAAGQLAADISKDLGSLKSDWVGVASSSSDRYVVFSRTDSKQQTDLFIRDTDTGDELQLTNTPQQEWQPSWRAGSRLIAYNVTDVDNSKATPTFGATHIYVMSLAEDGSPTTPIRLIGDDQGDFDGYAAWSSTDNLIAFVSNREGGVSNVYLMEYSTNTDANPYIGVLTTMLSPQMVAEQNLTAESGAIVREVASGSPADLAGIEPQDIITSIANASISDLQPISTILSRYNPGDTVPLKLVRKGNPLSFNVQTSPRPANARPDR